MADSSAASPQIRRLVLVPAAATTTARGDELVRRYRLARLRLEGREAATARPLSRARGQGA